MSPSGETLRSAVGRAVARCRRQAVGAVLLTTAGIVPLVLLLAWVGGAWTSRTGPLILVLAGVVAVLGLAGMLTRRWVLAVTERAVAVAAERERGLPDGSLRAVLELGREFPAGVSRALLHRTEQELVTRLSAPGDLAGAVGRAARRRRIRTAVAAAALTLAAAGVGLATPDRARAAWAPLLNPVTHLNGATLPGLRVLPGDTVVDRGERLGIEVRARLRREVMVHWRSVGDVPGARRLNVDAAGAATGTVGPVHAAIDYWVTAPDGAVSDTFRVEPRDPLLVSALAVDVVYPAHTGLGADHYEGEIPALRVPEGTLIRARGRAARPLGAAALVGSDGSEREAEVVGTTFRVEWRVAVEHRGRWDWRLRGRAGEEARLSDALNLAVFADQGPTVRIVSPGTDTILPASRRLPIVADAADDYGIRTAVLVYHRVGGPPDSTTVTLPTTPLSSRVLLRGVLDVAGLELVPGDAVAYYVAVTDNSPAGQTARSGTYTLRLPAMADLRDRARHGAEAALDDARRLADRARSLEAATRDASRSARGGGRPGAAPVERRAESERLGFNDAAEAREVLEDHERVLSDVQALRDAISELERAVAEAGLRDPELQRRLEELQDLYERVATQELRDAMERLRAAVDDLDPDAVRAALQRLEERQAEFRQQVEESLELLRRAAVEQEMNALARDAEELAAQQEALSEAVREENGVEAEDRVGQQATLGERTDGLSAGLEALHRDLEALGERRWSDAVGEAGERSRSARGAMTEAADAVRRREPVAAADRGRAAAGDLRAAAETVDRARESMAAARADQAQESVRQATQEALGLAEGEEALRRAMERAQQQGGMGGRERQEMRSEQAALQQGLEQLARNLSETGRRSAMVDRAVSQALERARRDMQRTAAGMEGSPSPMPIREAGEAVESLNQLAMSLLRNDGRIQQAREGGDGVQQALQRMAELARDQGALNGQIGALAPMELARQALARQLREMARQQQRIADGVTEAGDALADRDEVLGQVDELAGEAAEIARALAEGRLDPEVRARQERLFHRLLDAGRSLERDEYSDERVGEGAGEVGTDPPAPLDPSLLDTGLRYPLPTAEELRGLPPAYRALILEYFDRLNRGGTERGGASGGAGSDTGGRGGTP